MAASVRSISKAKPLVGLAAMIDKAGELNAQANAYLKAYNDLRKEIAMRMPLGAEDQIEEEFGDEYEAKHFYPEEKSISPEKLMKAVGKDVFFGLIRVHMGDAEQYLDKALYYKLVEVNRAVAPRLVVSKQKKKTAA